MLFRVPVCIALIAVARADHVNIVRIPVIGALALSRDGDGGCHHGNDAISGSACGAMASPRAQSPTNDGAAGCASGRQGTLAFESASSSEAIHTALSLPLRAGFLESCVILGHDNNHLWLLCRSVRIHEQVIQCETGESVPEGC
jgi:hypothetical protein